MKPEPKNKDAKDRNEPSESGECDTVSRAEIDLEFQRIARENLERYRSAMKELAK